MTTQPKRLTNVSITEVSCVPRGSNPLADMVMHKAHDKVENKDLNINKRGDDQVSDELKKALQEKETELAKALEAAKEAEAKIAKMEAEKAAEAEALAKAETKVEKTASEILVEKQNIEIQKMRDEIAFEKARPAATEMFKSFGGETDVMTKTYLFIEKADPEVKAKLEEVIKAASNAIALVKGEKGTKAESGGAGDSYTALTKAYAKEHNVSEQIAMLKVNETAEGKAAYNAMRAEQFA